MKRRIQHLDFAFTVQNQTLSSEIQIDSRYNFIEKITFNGSRFPAECQIENFSIEGDSSIFEQGTLISHFQNLIEQSGFEIAQNISDKAKIRVSLKDNTLGLFSNYNIQIALFLRINE